MNADAERRVRKERRTDATFPGCEQMILATRPSLGYPSLARDLPWRGGQTSRPRRVSWHFLYRPNLYQPDFASFSIPSCSSRACRSPTCFRKIAFKRLSTSKESRSLKKRMRSIPRNSPCGPRCRRCCSKTSSDRAWPLCCASSSCWWRGTRAPLGQYRRLSSCARQVARGGHSSADVRGVRSLRARGVEVMAVARAAREAG